MAKKPSPSDLADKFILRLPDGLRERIAIQAQTNRRSMNSELVARIEASLAQEDAQRAAVQKLDALLRQCDAALTILKRLEARGAKKR